MITAPPEQHVVDLIQDFRAILDSKLVAPPVITDRELEAIDLGPTADPWWWRGTELQVVCSNVCLEDILDSPTSLDGFGTAAASRLSAWHLPKDGQWRLATEPWLGPTVASLAHVSTESDRIGAWFIVDPGLGDTFAFDRSHVSDAKMLGFSADVVWPPASTGATAGEDMSDGPDLDLQDSDPTALLRLDITLRAGHEMFPLGQAELEVPESLAGEESLLVDVPQWLTRRLILDGDADADRLSSLIGATIAAHFALPADDTSEYLPPYSLVVKAIKTLRMRHKTEFPEIVWGISPWGPIFLRRADAESWAEAWFALGCSSTWGVLRHRIPPARIGWMQQTLERCSYETERLTDRTDVSELRWLIKAGNLWPWLADTSHQVDDVLAEMPPQVWQILDEEGERLSSTPDGDYIRYRDGRRIADAIESVGFRCLRNDQLITDALGPLA